MSLQSTSKYMSLILRHKPEVIGITLDEHGWADEDVLTEDIIHGAAHCPADQIVTETIFNLLEIRRSCVA